MKYNITVTSKQSALIQSHIYDLCNIGLSFYRCFEEIDTRSIDEYDVIRARLYFKETVVKKRKSNSIRFIDLTKDELQFISHELQHFVLSNYIEDSDRYDQISAKALINKINKTLSQSYQREIKLKQLGI